MRYKNLFLLMICLTLAGCAVDAALRLFNAPISLTDRSGPGEILVFVIVLPSLLWFAQAVGGVNAFAFLRAYAREWRRILRGFGFTLLLALTAMFVIHVVLAYTGTLAWSQEAWANLTPHVWKRTVTSLLVVLVLATTEELIFRGFVLRYLRWNSSTTVTVAAVLVSSVIFSLSHIIALGSDATGPLLFGLFCLGVLLGTAYVATGSLACSIGVHAGLLSFKVFLHRTGLVDYLSGERDDLRMSPSLWMALLLAAILLIVLSKWLRPLFWIETAVGQRADEAGHMGFRLEGRPETARG